MTTFFFGSGSIFPDLFFRAYPSPIQWLRPADHPQCPAEDPQLLSILSHRPNPTPAQQQVLTTLTETWSTGSQTLFDLLSFKILRMFFLTLVQES